MEALKSLGRLAAARMREPSTWATIGGLSALGSFGVDLGDPFWQQLWQGVTYVGMGAGFFLGILLPEKGRAA